MHPSNTPYLGLAVHQDSMAVAYVAHAHGAEGPSRGPRGPRQGDLDRLTRKRQSQATPLICVYEAGPCGDWLHRDLPPQGDDCRGVAPSVIPQKPGDRVETARRDAVQLARLARSGALTVAYGPSGGR